MKSILREWKGFVLLILILLLIPYAIDIPRSISPFTLDLAGLFYIFDVGRLNLVLYQTPSLISIVNLILVIIPSLYFTFRFKNRIAGESIEILALITLALTLLVVGIVDPMALVIQRQIDTYQSPTPNLQFLPGFAFLLLFFSVIVPVFRENTTDLVNTHIRGDHYRSGFRTWISSLIPKTTSGWLLAFLLVAPAVLTLEIHTISFLTWSSNLNISIMSPYYMLFLRYTSSGPFAGITFEFIWGGLIALFNLLAFQIVGMIFSFSVVLYIQNRISRRLLIVSGLLSFSLPLFLSLFSIFSIILQFNGAIILPIPLLQLLGILLIRRVESLRSIALEYKSVKPGSEIVKVPVGYILTSLIRRIIRGMRRDSGESALERNESEDIGR